MKDEHDQAAILSWLEGRLLLTEQGVRNHRAWHSTSARKHRPPKLKHIAFEGRCCCADRRRDYNESTSVMPLALILHCCAMQSLKTLAMTMFFILALPSTTCIR